jgi:3-hydroxyisobutyrate dehydrogenase
MTPAGVGFLGLGSIGLPMAQNIARGGMSVLAYDIADPVRWALPPLERAASIAEVAGAREFLLLSLPDGAAVRTALAEILATEHPRVHTVIDLSTIGVKAGREFDALCTAAGIAYVDAPVSGGVTGARERKLSLMAACPERVFAAVRPILAAFAGRVFHVGERPGQGQALKLLNNFLSANALAATSEAVRFGLANGLQMSTILDVLKVSSGRNSAVEDKFVNHVAKGRYDSGFRNTLMAKDVELYLKETLEAKCSGRVGELIAGIWTEFSSAMPGADFTAIYEFVRNG